MSKALNGLRTALARTGSSVVAIAEMQTADLLAAMTDEQKVEVSAGLASAGEASTTSPANAGEYETEDQPEDEVGDKKKKAKKDDDPAEPEASAADPRIKAVAAAVETDDACKGKAALALQMLADDDYAGLSASGVIKLLGKQNAGQTVSEADPEAAARAEMRDAIQSTNNSNLDASGGHGGTPASAGQSAWNNVLGRMNKTA